MPAPQELAYFFEDGYLTLNDLQMIYKKLHGSQAVELLENHILTFEDFKDYIGFKNDQFFLRVKSHEIQSKYPNGNTRLEIFYK